MNCSQARTILAAYRELKNGQMDTAALEIHLSSCADCKAFLAQSNLIGQQIRALPVIAPPADARTKLMKALAAEHTRFIQHASPSTRPTPVPAFLAPYLKEHAQENLSNIAAFSTAETGPLPVLPMPRKHRNARRAVKMSPFAVVGLAAAFLMVIMAGGLTSLVILANRGLPTVRQDTVAQLSQLSQTNYTTATSYPYVVSAVADRQNIYYTAYGNTNNWMLSLVNNTTKVSTPLLAHESTDPLIVLNSSANWLIWLQFDLPKTVTNKIAHSRNTTSHEIRTWTLQATYIGTDPATLLTPMTPVTLQKGIFDAATAPAWIHTPVQGIWQGQNTALVTSIDQQGISHLTRYQLDPEKSPAALDLATSGTGHILTSPTMNSDGTSIYWSEEWMSSTNVLYSNIWSQKITSAALPLQGTWGHQASTDTYLFRDDEKSFHPQVVNDMLFLLNVNNATVTNLVTPDTAATSLTPTASATPSMQTSAGLAGRINTTFYNLAPDASLQGSLRAFSVNTGAPLQLPTDNLAVQAPQAGSRFLLWQSGSTGIGMYDAVAKQSVIVGNDPIPSNTALLAVNGDTTVWTTSSSNSTTNTTVLPITITFGTFNWPGRAPAPAIQP